MKKKWILLLLITISFTSLTAQDALSGAARHPAMCSCRRAGVPVHGQETL